MKPLPRKRFDTLPHNHGSVEIASLQDVFLIEIRAIFTTEPLQPRKLTCLLKTSGWKTRFPFEMAPFFIPCLADMLPILQRKGLVILK